MSGDQKPFNIADFEELIGRLSHSIVLFPEAPGSFAELGYFSKVPTLAGKTILVIDSKRQLNDSFISLGPAASIADVSIFRPTIYTNYEDPDFDLIKERIVSRKPISPKRRTVKYDSFKKVTDYDLFALIFESIGILKFATSDDLIYVLRAMFKGNVDPSRILKVISILVGSGKVEEFGELGHLMIVKGSRTFFKVRDGYREQLAEVKISISQIVNTAADDFAGLKGRLAHVG